MAFKDLNVNVFFPVVRGPRTQKVWEPMVKSLYFQHKSEQVLGDSASFLIEKKISHVTRTCQGPGTPGEVIVMLIVIG